MYVVICMIYGAICRAIVLATIDEVAATTHERIHELFLMESKKPFTMHADLLEDFKERFSKYLIFYLSSDPAFDGFEKPNLRKEDERGIAQVVNQHNLESLRAKVKEPMLDLEDAMTKPVRADENSIRYDGIHDDCCRLK